MVQIFNIDTDEEHDDSLQKLIQKKLSPDKVRVIANSNQDPQGRHSGHMRHSQQQVLR